MKKVSKDMQKVLKAYQAIANKGDKELKTQNTITITNRFLKQEIQFYQ